MGQRQRKGEGKERKHRKGRGLNGSAPEGKGKRSVSRKKILLRRTGGKKGRIGLEKKTSISQKAKKKKGISYILKKKKMKLLAREREISRKKKENLCYINGAERILEASPDAEHTRKKGASWQQPTQGQGKNKIGPSSGEEGKRTPARRKEKEFFPREAERKEDSREKEWK